MPAKTAFEMTFEVLKQYGLAAAVLVGGLIFTGALFFFLLRWVMSQQEKRDAQALVREERLIKIIDGQNAALVEHNKVTMDFRNEVNRAMQYQRNEHSSMMEAIKTGGQQMSETLHGLTDVIHRLIERGRAD